MNIPVDVWLRGQHVATTVTMDLSIADPNEWDDGDVRAVLEAMLRAMYRQKYPDREDQGAIAFRGLSWIVNHFDQGGVVIAIEITLGAAIAGPIDIDLAVLEAMITRIVSASGSLPLSSSVH